MIYINLDLLHEYKISIFITLLMQRGEIVQRCYSLKLSQTNGSWEWSWRRGARKDEWQTVQPPTDSSFGNTDWHSRRTLPALPSPSTYIQEMSLRWRSKGKCKEKSYNDPRHPLGEGICPNRFLMASEPYPPTKRKTSHMSLTRGQQLQTIENIF